MRSRRATSVVAAADEQLAELEVSAHRVALSQLLSQLLLLLALFSSVTSARAGGADRSAARSDEQPPLPGALLLDDDGVFTLLVVFFVVTRAGDGLVAVLRVGTAAAIAAASGAGAGAASAGRGAKPAGFGGELTGCGDDDNKRLLLWLLSQKTRLVLSTGQHKARLRAEALRRVRVDAVVVPLMASGPAGAHVCDVERVAGSAESVVR